MNDQGEWLVVKKKYGGLKGKWSFPAGFVQENESLEGAVVREVKEETGILASVQGVIGVRTGVLEKGISDNMIIFLMRAYSSQIVIQENEISEACFCSPNKLEQDPDSSLLLVEFAKRKPKTLDPYYHFNPGDQFGYKSYTLFL